MGSLRRTVEGWMGDALYDKLGNEPCTEVAWGLLRDLVGQHLFGSEFVTVPFIESSSYFNQLFVFIKKQNFFSTIGLRPPTYKIIGNLDYLVNSDLSTWTPHFDFSPWDVADGHNMYSEYRLRITSNQVGVQKSIDLKVVEAHARGVQPPVPGSVTIRRNLLQDMNDVKTLYVITDVVLVSYLKIVVRIGNRNMTFVNDRGMPIGFKYRKYSLRKNGGFIAELDTELKFSEKQAIWLKPLPQPIPTVPLWDFMRRRYRHGFRRKIRNNLTIPTHGESPHIGHPRQNGGVLRHERLDGAVLRATDVIRMGNNAPEDAWRNQVLQRVAQDIENRRIAARGTVSMETLHGSE